MNKSTNTVRSVELSPAVPIRNRGRKSFDKVLAKCEKNMASLAAPI